MRKVEVNGKKITPQSHSFHCSAESQIASVNKAVTQTHKGHFKIILIIKYVRTILKTTLQCTEVSELIFHALYNASYHVNSYESK